MTSDGSAQVHLAPLIRSEALYLLGGTAGGFVVYGRDAATVRLPAFHSIDRGDIVILTVMTAELETLLEAGQPLTYLAEAVDATTLAGWYATVTGPADIVVDPHQRDHYRRVLPGFEPTQGTRVIRLNPDVVGGHRFQRLTADR